MGGYERSLKVKGVVPDITDGILTASTANFEQPYQVYILLRDYPAVTVIVRSALPMTTLGEMVRQKVSLTLKDQPVSSVISLQALIAEKTSVVRFYVTLLCVFTAVSIFLTWVGTYTLAKRYVLEDRHAYAVRLALGAMPYHIAWVLLRRGLRVVIAGSVPGIALAYFASAAVVGSMPGVAKSDPLVLLCLEFILSTIIMASFLFAGRQIVKIAPAKALRAE